MRQRQLRHDVELVVDVEQFVAEGSEHDAPDIGAPHRGIEDIGVLGEADAQGGLGMGDGFERKQGCRRKYRQTQDFHRNYLHLMNSGGCRRARPDYTNPVAACYFRATTEGGDQFFQRRREPAIGGDDGIRRRQLRHAVTGRGVAGCIGQ